MDETPTTKDPIREQARKSLKAKAEFRSFLGIWFGVSVLLLGIWAFTSWNAGGPLYFWPAWPIGGMGIAAFFIWLDAYGPGRRLITESDIDAEVERLRARGR